MASEIVIEALELLHKELDNLRPAIEHIEAAKESIKAAKSIPEKHMQLIKDLRDVETKHKSDLKEIFTKELTFITEETKKIQKSARSIADEIATDLKELDKIQAKIEAFQDRIDKVNFPDRLDRLDANVAGIMAAIQSIQSRLDGLERNILDKLKDSIDYQKETRHSVKIDMDNLLKSTQESINALSNQNKTQIYITWGLIAVIGLILAILLLTR